MKTPKEIADAVRNGMGNFLRADPVLVTGDTMIEVVVRDIQVEAIQHAAKICDNIMSLHSNPGIREGAKQCRDRLMQECLKISPPKPPTEPTESA